MLLLSVTCIDIFLDVPPPYSAKSDSLIQASSPMVSASTPVAPTINQSGTPPPTSNNQPTLQCDLFRCAVSCQQQQKTILKLGLFSKKTRTLGSRIFLRSCHCERLPPRALRRAKSRCCLPGSECPSLASFAHFKPSSRMSERSP